VPLAPASRATRSVSMDSITPGWRFVHIGYEGDDVEIGGVKVWGIKWVPLRDRITVAHPMYPAQRHPMWTYQLPGPSGPVEFAAGEFSNGVWGIFVPV
jgi:hypothetical protein